MLIKTNSENYIGDGYLGFEKNYSPFSPRKVRDFCGFIEKCKEIKKFYHDDTTQFKEAGHSEAGRQSSFDHIHFYSKYTRTKEMNSASLYEAQ